MSRPGGGFGGPGGGARGPGGPGGPRGPGGPGGPRRNAAPIGPRMNDRIRITPVRLIDQHGTMIGVVETDEARRMAAEAGLDLVEIVPDVRPPVCKIIDYGKHKYEQSKQDRANRAKSKTQELKEVRLGRSMKIDPHDVEIRLKQAREFLLEGHKVLIVQNFRGREMAHQERGLDRMQDVAAKLADLGRVELQPRLNGRRLNMIVAPDKSKVDQYRRKHGLGEAAPAATAAPQTTEATAAPRTTESPAAPAAARPAGESDAPAHEPAAG